MSPLRLLFRSSVHNSAFAFSRSSCYTSSATVSAAAAVSFFLPPSASLVYREGVTPDQTRSVFEDLFRRLGLDQNVLTVDMLFCGPNIAAGLHNVRHSFHHNISPSGTGRSLDTGHDGGVLGIPAPERQPTPLVNASCPGSSGVSVTFHFNTGLYHDVSDLFSAPDALFLFNAGLWGYDDWVPTLEHVLGCDDSSAGIEATPGDSGGASPPSLQPEPSTLNSSAPPPSGVVVVTSYCAEEAEDDMETVERIVLEDARRSTCSGPSATARPKDASQVEWLWKPEVNPHRSLVPRHAACAVEGRVLFENQMWQAIRPSRSSR